MDERTGGTKLISTEQRSVNERRRQTHVELVNTQRQGQGAESS